MSPFWSAWVIFFIVLNLGVALFLFVFSQRVEIPTDPDGTTGHVWAHGVVREGVRRLPLWWVVFSAAMFVAAIGYLALYPGFGGYRGLLGWTSAEEHAQAAVENEARLDAVFAALDERGVDRFSSGHPVAVEGRRLFLDNCAACHRMDASGNPALGAPNLTDSVWLYGGAPDTVVASILNGRRGTMPAWGEALGEEGVVDVAAYVLTLSGRDAPPGWAAAGKARFDTTCAACHGIDGKGMQALGAPNLTDDDWLYGGDLATVMESIRNGRSGEMPAWRERLTEEQARAIAAWLYTQQ
ncbi:MAG TPA: cytochrome-c oxidase, cbb3-type subunit III [Gammaproteobacteria bacterium]